MSRDDTINMEHYEILSLAHKICNVCQKLSKRCPGGLCGNAVRKAKEIYYSQFAKDKKVRANGMREKQMIEVITYEQDRLNYFTDLMEKAQKRYKQLFKKYKDAPYVSEEAQMLSDAGRETHFLGDVVEMLEKGYRKQSEGEWKVKDRAGTSIRGFMVCSVCDVMIPTCDNDRYCLSFLDYCPNCGAKMKGGEDNA